MTQTLSILLLCCAAFGQTASLRNNIFATNADTIDAMAVPDDKKPVLMVFETWEKCYECGTRYLMVCTDGSNECNVPLKTVLHFAWFASEEQALKRAEIEQWQVTWLGVTVRANFTRTETEKHDPQPDKVTKTIHYKVKSARASREERRAK